MSRLDKLRELVAAQPDDPFTHYGLGLELAKQEAWQEALVAFEGALLRDPQYVAAYLQKARAELRLDRRDDARQTLDAGLLAARGAGDRHAADEMQKMLETL